MPFDATPTIDNPLTFSPGKEGLRKLAYVLRHKELWLKHKWNFMTPFRETECGTVGCALGIARVMWPEKIIANGRICEQLAAQFDMSPSAASDIFHGGAFTHMEIHHITPVVVADAIDRYLATGHV
jgi:hypothetical protein